jgi:V8-like Glu-specific endopeptidase
MIGRHVDVRLNRGRLTRRLGLVVSVTALLVSYAAAPAQAADEPSPLPDEGFAIIQGTVVSDPVLAQRLIEQYWTPERMRAAIPEDFPADIDDPALEAADRPGDPGPEETVAEPIQPSPTTNGQGPSAATGVNASPGVGKVFFTKENGKDYVCSGGAINNPTKNMVSTAGHCIHGGKHGTWHHNWTYVPYYDHGSAPYGIWAAKYFTTVKGWTKHSYSWWDFGWVNVHTNAGKKLIHKTGGQGLSVNYGKKIGVTLLGYPAAAPYDGQWQHYCQGHIFPKGVQRVGIVCPMTPGSSGGPYLRAWDNDLRFGYTNGVISHGGGGKIYSPYFDTAVKNNYNVAKNKA